MMTNAIEKMFEVVMALAGSMIILVLTGAI